MTHLDARSLNERCASGVNVFDEPDTLETAAFCRSGDDHTPLKREESLKLGGR